MSQYPPSDADVSTAQSLGRVEGTLGAMGATLTALAATLEDDRKQTADARAVVHDTLSKMNADIAKLRTDMDLVKPMTEKLQHWQAVGLGAILTVGAIGTVIGTFLAYFKDKILQVIWGP